MHNIHIIHRFLFWHLLFLLVCVFCKARAARKIAQCREVNGKVELRPAILACRYFRRDMGRSSWRKEIGFDNDLWMEMHSGGVGDAFSLVVVIHSFLLGLKWMIDYLVVFSLNRICTMWVCCLDWLGRPWRPFIHFFWAWNGWLTTWLSFLSTGFARWAWHSWHWVCCLDWLGRPWRPALCVAGVAQPHIHLRFAWQACHNRTSTIVSCGRRGTHGTGWRAWTGLVARDARDAAALCVAGVAQTHIHRRFAWQAWHNLTSTVVLRGRRGTHGTGWRAWTGLVARDARDAAALCVAGVAQPHIHRRFAWQAWHNLTATVSQSNIHDRFAWQAWHSWHWVACLDWLGRPWRPWRRDTLRGRRGTTSHPPSFCVAGVAKLTSTVILRGRRGTNSHLPSFCVAGVALMALGGALGLAWAPVTPRHFAWQAWHNLTSTFVSRGRRGTNSHLPSFHVAGVALMALGKWNWSFACKDAVLARGREAGLNCASATLCSADMTDSVSCMQTFIMLFLSFCFCFGPTRSCRQQL